LSKLVLTGDKEFYTNKTRKWLFYHAAFVLNIISASQDSHWLV